MFSLRAIRTRDDRSSVLRITGEFVLDYLAIVIGFA